jgi:4-hydroxybenzoyl-CoA reductase alpha subunit
MSEPTPAPQHPHFHREGGQVVGKPVPLLDAKSKVTGEAIYTDDLKLPAMLVGKILRSPLPHARIVRIDTSRAEALPGVRAVVTGQESSGHFGVLPISEDETAMAIDKVRYIGDCVAGVAAEDEETALAALRLIDVEYQELPAILSIEDGLKPTADPIHARTLGGTNVQKFVEQNFGDVGQAFQQAAFVREGQFRFIGVTHAFTEPHCVIAHYDADARLHIWSATQVPHYLHRALATVMEMDMHRIRVIRPMVGGAFGGKSDPFPHEMIAALLSRRSGRPVKIRFDREEVFLTNHGRHPTKTAMKIALDSDLKLSALELDAKIDGGAWGSFGVVTTYYNGVLCMGPYRIQNFHYTGRRVYTNKPPCGAMRGHGAVNSRFAMEVLIDQLAEDARIDPIELRLKNLLPPFTKTLNEFRITSNGTQECLERVQAACDWSRTFRRLPLGEGIGIACGFYISGSALPIHWTSLPQSTVHLKIDADGGITVHSLAAEIGQGSDTMLAQCVAEPLGVKLDRIRIYARDSDTAPIDLGSYSSRVTFMAGNAARKAAEEIRGELVQAASRLTGYPPEGFILRDERVIYAPNPEIEVTYMKALEEALAKKGALIARGAYTAAPPMGGKHKGAAAGLSPSYSFQAYAARVKTDLETGEVRVVKVWAAHDCGRALNPLAVTGQIEGCIHMGLGQVLVESMDYNRGNLENPNLLDYRTLSPKQMPQVEVILVETNDPEGPFGAKEAGEGPLLPILPAVANAIYDAIGVRFYQLPITPDRVVKAMDEAGGPKKPALPHTHKPADAPRRPKVPAGSSPTHTS